MPDVAFYNAGCSPMKGPRGVLVLARRILRRVLWPMFQHQAALFQHLLDRHERSEHTVLGVQNDMDALAKRQAELDQRIETLLAFGWDYVAMVRRLAVLEDQLLALGVQPVAPGDEAEARPSIPFPGFEPAPEARSKVS